ncbi:MAG TPA: ribonuclease Z [Syntrophus sp. (in: bacteria)]|jgi:ribonuclease Z|nr:ribonuclease Z [Syntrophus sp. (in: bacteria)]
MFNTVLVNGPGGDPCVYLEMKYRRRALLFDLGELHALPPRNILKVEHICVSHTHMDHFIGFDHLIRICLGRDRHIALYGPPGFLEQVESRLRAYTWNLVEQYVNDFVIIATEADPKGQMKTRRFSCRRAFRAEGEDEIGAFDGLLFEDRYFSLQGAFLDHKIPCLAFRAEEKRRINIRKDALQELGLPAGPWLNGLKDCIVNDCPPDFPVRIWWKNEKGLPMERWAPLGTLADRIVKITPGQKIAYVTDALYSEDNAGIIVNLARDADILFIEGSFLDVEAEQAARKYHLTARQAGALAREAGVKRMIPFHFSPKYCGFEDQLIDEAETAFRGNSTQREAL